MPPAAETLLISDTNGDAARVPGLIRTFTEHRVEGLIYVAGHHQKAELPPLPPSTRRVLANCFDTRGTPAVVPDDFDGMRALVAAILARGHRRIAYLTLPVELVATDLRLAGYRAALEAAGLPFDPGLVACGEPIRDDTPAEMMWDQLHRLLDRPAPPTAICCGNDRMAMRLYGLLRANGIRVPQDISVAGYDDYRLIAETLYPQLTTMELAYERIGERAAELLLEMLDAPAEGAAGLAPERVRGRVIWRQSVTERTEDKEN